MDRYCVWRLILTAVCLLSLGVLAPGRAIAADTVFTTEDVLLGTTSTEAACRAHRQALWVVVDGKGDCMRYYGNDIPERSTIALIYFTGDHLFRRWFKDGRTRGRLVPSFYENVLTESWLRDLYRKRFAEATAGRAGKLTALLFARPGILGSSGHHKDRRQPREVALINAALDQLKTRYQIDQFALAGLSGGGHVVGSMLSQRGDVRCGVIGAGVVAVAARIADKNWPTDATGYKTFFDPIAHVEKIAMPTGGRVFVVGDPRDTIVPYSTQELYHKELKLHGIDAHLTATPGKGRRYHNVRPQVLQAAAACAYGDDTAAILAQIPKYEAPAAEQPAQQ